MPAEQQVRLAWHLPQPGAANGWGGVLVLCLPAPFAVLQGPKAAAAAALPRHVLAHHCWLVAAAGSPGASSWVCQVTAARVAGLLQLAAGAVQAQAAEGCQQQQDCLVPQSRTWQEHRMLHCCLLPACPQGLLLAASVHLSIEQQEV